MIDINMIVYAKNEIDFDKSICSTSMFRFKRTHAFFGRITNFKVLNLPQNLKIRTQVSYLYIKDSTFIANKTIHTYVFV